MKGEVKAPDTTDFRGPVDELFDLLEQDYEPSISTEIREKLFALDVLNIEGRLTQTIFDRCRSDIMALAGNRSWHCAKDAKDANRNPALFGDYGLLIDQLLGGSPKIKQRVADADRDGRHGLAVLEYHLKKADAQMSIDLERILMTCRNDQDLYESQKTDVAKIEQRGSSFRVRTSIKGKRVDTSFSTLREAQDHRDLNVA